MTTETKKPRRFRPWVWVAILPGVMTLIAPVTGSPGVAISWLIITGLVVFLAWRVRKTPWWAVFGWLGAAYGGLVAVLSALLDGAAPAGSIVLLCIGTALGIAGLIVNSIKSAATPTPPA